MAAASRYASSWTHSFIVFDANEFADVMEETKNAISSGKADASKPLFAVYQNLAGKIVMGTSLRSTNDVMNLATSPTVKLRGRPKAKPLGMLSYADAIENGIVDSISADYVAHESYKNHVLKRVFGEQFIPQPSEPKPIKEKVIKEKTVKEKIVKPPVVKEKSLRQRRLEAAAQVNELVFFFHDLKVVNKKPEKAPKAVKPPKPKKPVAPPQALVDAETDLSAYKPKKLGRPLLAKKDPAPQPETQIPVATNGVMEKVFIAKKPKDKVPIHNTPSQKWADRYTNVLGGMRVADNYTIVCTLAFEAGKIDRHTPQNSPDKAIGTLESFKDAKITGSALYRLHTMFCQNDYEKTTAIATALHFGMVQDDLLRKTLFHERTGLNIDAIVGDVKKKFPDFGYKG